MMDERHFLAVPWGCLWFVIVVFPYHTHLLFLGKRDKMRGLRLASHFISFSQEV